MNKRRQKELGPPEVVVALRCEEVEQSDESWCEVCQVDKVEGQKCNGTKGIDRNKTKRLKKWITN